MKIGVLPKDYNQPELLFSHLNLSGQGKSDLKLFEDTPRVQNLNQSEAIQAERRKFRTQPLPTGITPFAVKVAPKTGSLFNECPHLEDLDSD